MIAIDELADLLRGLLRRRLIVLVDHADALAADATGRVHLLDGEDDPFPRIAPEARVRAREREVGPDEDLVRVVMRAAHAEREQKQYERLQVPAW